MTRTDYPACWLWPLPDEPVSTLTAAYAWQDRRCAICGTTDRAMVEDHDHETSWIRGKLCRSCNALEGHAGLDVLQFERYRLVNPASIFGVEEAYVDMFGVEAKPAEPVDFAVQVRMAQRFSLLLSDQGEREPFVPGPPVDRLSVVCPYCEAAVGQPCRTYDRYGSRTAGRTLTEPHTRRWPPREPPPPSRQKAYMHVRDGDIARQLQLGAGVEVDLDAADRVLGIEVLPGGRVAGLLTALLFARFPRDPEGGDVTTGQDMDKERTR